MKTGMHIALTLGICVMIALIAREGAGTIAVLLSAAGWPLLLLVPLQALPLLLDVFGWRVLIGKRVRLPVLFVIAAIRQAINRLLPVANVGGDIVGIRLLTYKGLDGPFAAASVVVELVIALAAQFSFAIMGSACVLMRFHDARLMNGLTLGCAVSLSALTLIALALRSGRIFFHIEQIAARLLSRWFHGIAALNQGAALDARIRELFVCRRRLLGSFGWQLAGLVAGSSETWLALRLLGHPLSVTAAIALESLIQAAKSLFFIVPAGIGIQEAGLIGIGRWFGLDAELALTLSLVKRMREIVFGLPALAIWQWIEGRRLATHAAQEQAFP